MSKSALEDAKFCDVCNHAMPSFAWNSLAVNPDYYDCPNCKMTTLMWRYSFGSYRHKMNSIGYKIMAKSGDMPPYLLKPLAYPYERECYG